MALLATLIENFDDNSINGSLWEKSLVESFWLDAAVSVLETNRQAEIFITQASGVHANGFRSVNTYDLTGSEAVIRLKQTGGTNSSLFTVGIDDTHFLRVRQSFSDLVIEDNSGALVTLTYSSSTHAWLRIRHTVSGDTYQVDTAPNTASDPPISGDWVNRYSGARTFTITAVKLSFGAASFSDSGSGVGTVVFDGVNGATMGPITALTIVAPDSGVLSNPSTVFTVGTLPVGAALPSAIIHTPSDGGAGGTFSPTTVTLPANTSDPTATYTYTPASIGTKTISYANNQSLTNPSNTSFLSADIRTGFVHAWELEETGNNNRQDAVGTAHLTAVNMAQATGLVGQAAQFTEANSPWLHRASEAGLQLANAPFTIAGLVRFDSLTDIHSLVGKMISSGAQDMEFWVSHPGTAIFGNVLTLSMGDGIVAGTISQAISSVAMVASQWHRFIAWYDGVRPNIRVDREAVSQGIPITGFQGSGEFQMGAVSGTHDFNDGRLDQVYLWSKALTSGEQDWLDNSGNWRSVAAIQALGATGVTVTPGTIALSLAALAPVPTLQALPGAVGLAASALAPKATLQALPGAVALALSAPGPLPTLQVLPGAIATSLSVPAPSPALQAKPGAVALALSSLAPTPTIQVLPPVVALALSILAPSIQAGSGVTVNPSTIALALSALAVTPAIQASPGAVAMALSVLAATPTLQVTPGTMALLLAALAPTASGPSTVTVTPGVIALTMAVLAATPTLQARPSTVALVLQVLALAVGAQAARALPTNRGQATATPTDRSY